MSDVTVRLAQPSDEDGVCLLWGALCKENSRIFEPEKVRTMVRRSIGKDGGIMIVIGDDDIKACICLLIDPVWFSNDVQLVSLFDFVRNDSRSGKLGYKKALINYAKKAADDLGVEFITGIFTDDTANDNLEAKLRIYSKLLPKAGEFYRYNPEKSINGCRSHSQISNELVSAKLRVELLNKELNRVEH